MELHVVLQSLLPDAIVIEIVFSIGFDTLRSLCIAGAKEWAPDNLGALAKLVSRLEALQLTLSCQIKEVRTLH